MHKARAVNHWIENEGLSKQEALQRWDDEELKAKHRLYKGPPDSKLQIPVKLEDFLVSEDAIIEEKVKTRDFRRVKHTQEADDLMEEGLMSGRGWSSEDVEKNFGMPSESADLAASIFGRRAKLPQCVAPAASAAPSAEEPPKARGKAFDAATERVALVTKLTSIVDKEVETLVATHKEVQAFMDADFQAALVSVDTPANDLDAMKLLAARYEVSKTILGKYVPGKALPEEGIIQADEANYARVLATEAAELPDMFGVGCPVLKMLSMLHEEVKGVASSADKKVIETEFRPAANLLAVMKTSLKSALDKIRKFHRERQAREDKQRRAQEAAQVKLLNSEKKKREADEKKLNRAAEKQGRVSSLYEIDFVKLGIRVMEQVTLKNEDDVRRLDFGKPFIVKQESEALQSLQKVLQDKKIRSGLDSFYNGFPGSAASLQGSRRFTSPIAQSKPLRDLLLKDFGVEESLEGGCLAKHR